MSTPRHPLSPALLLAPLVLLCAPSALHAQAEESIEARYHAAAAAGDEAALVALWRAHPDAVLGTIDADLEGSLALREEAEAAGQPADESAIAPLHARALFGARAAQLATGHPIFVDYVASFVGWDAEQRRSFRAGQAAFGEARAALKDGRHEEALAAGRRCSERAAALGDWWGTAMGLTAQGQALAGLGRHEEAVVALSKARILHHDLGLTGSEYGNLLGLVAALEQVGSAARLAAAATQAIELGTALGDEAGVARARALLAAGTSEAPAGAAR